MNTPASRSAPSQVIRCAGCHQDNSAERKFCGNCGNKLWEPCLDCDSINPVDERFCGNCGSNLQEAIRRREDEMKAKLERAIRLEREGRFYEANESLAAVTAKDDARFAKYQQNAKELLSELATRRKTKTIEAEQLEKQARAYVDQVQSVKAYESLKLIPVGLRSLEVIQLMAQMEAAYKEINSLTAEIKQAIQQKRYDSLLAKARRLLELEPHNREAEKLAERLEAKENADLSRSANNLAAQCNKLIAAKQYRKAGELADEIAPEFRKGKVEQICRLSWELAWCVRHLNEDVLATPTLAKLAKRLHRLSPSDDRALPLAKQVTERLQSKPKDRRFILPHWKPQPRSSRLGFPVRAWSGFSRCEAEADIRTQLDELPGQFVVAYGLALQGIGLGVLQHDLSPKKSSWGKVLSRKRPERVWGIDLGTTSLKGIELLYDREEETVHAVDCLHIDYSERLASVEDDDDRLAVMQEAVAEFVEHAGAKKPAVAVAFPSQRGIARFFDLPPIRSKKIKLADAVKYEMRSRIPLELEDAILSFHNWPTRGQGFMETNSVAAVAAHVDELKAWLQPISQNSCDLQLVQCDGFAIYNALHYEFLSRASAEDELAVGVLDIGGDASNFVIGQRDYVWMRSIALGTNHWSKLLTKSFSLTHSQAEKLLRDPTLGRWAHQVDATLQPSFEELANEITRSVNGFPRQPESQIELLLGVGGGFSQFGLLHHLLAQ